MMPYYLIVIPCLLGLFVTANIVGWLSVQDLERPWNWRALLGIPLYYRWLDRRDGPTCENCAALRAEMWRLRAILYPGQPMICNDAAHHASPCSCGNRPRAQVGLWTTPTTSSGRFEEAKRSGDVFKGGKRSD